MASRGDLLAEIERLWEAIRRHRVAVVMHGRGDDAHMELWQEAGVPDPLPEQRSGMPVLRSEGQS